MIRAALMVGGLVVVVTIHVFVEREIWKWHQRRRGANCKQQRSE